MMKKIFHNAYRLIKESKTILVASHVDPDADAVGSLLAFNEFLKKKGKKSHLYIGGGLSRRFSFFEDFRTIKKSLPSKKIDLLVGLDYGSFYRLHLSSLLEKQHPEILTFDHHAIGEKQGDIMALMPNATSTAEVLYYFFKTVRFPIDKKTANYLLAGILGDTIRLSINVTPELLSIVSELLRRGADFGYWSVNIFSPRSLPVLKLQARTLQKTVFHRATGLATIALPLREYKNILLDKNENNALVETIAGLPDIRAALFLKEERQGYWYGQLRSRQGINVGAIAKVFGGGGHRAASGFHAGGKPDRIIKKIISLIREQLK